MSKSNIVNSMNDLAECLKKISEIENRLQDDGVKTGVIIQDYDGWEVRLSAGIDMAADCVRRTAAVKDAGIKPIKRKEFKYHGITFVQHPKDNPTDIYE